MSEEKPAAPAKPKTKRGRFFRGVGEASGVSVVYRTGSAATETVAGSVQRTRGLLSLARRGSSSGVALEEVQAASLAGVEKFAASAAANGMDEAAVQVATTTTHRQALIYLTLALLGVTFGILSFSWDPVRGGAGAMTSLTRFAVVPILLALALRASYMNWVLRRRSLDGLVAFLRSRDWTTKAA